MLCAYLSAALLVGLLANALAGWWWADPAVGLLIAAVALHGSRQRLARRELHLLLGGGEQAVTVSRAPHHGARRFRVC